MTEILDWLRAQVKTHGVRPVAAALVGVAPPLARAVLALEQGLLDPMATRQVLQDEPTVPLPGVPPLPPVPRAQQEMWLRVLSACLVGGHAWPLQAGLWTEAPHLALPDRLEAALHWGQEQGRQVVYAAAHWAAAAQAQQWVNEQGAQDGMEVVTLEAALFTVAAASRQGLTQLSGWLGQALVLDGLHRLDVRGLQPVRYLLEDAASVGGLAICLTGAYPHALSEIKWPERTRPRARCTLHPEQHEVEAFVAAAQVAERPTLVLVPSRRAALEMLTALPGARLVSRSKTGHHLQDEATIASEILIGTWGAGVMNAQAYAQVISARAPLPLLAEVGELAPQVDIYPVTAFHSPNALQTGMSLTDEFLLSGAHPQDVATQEQFWLRLLPHVQQDAFEIQRRREQTEYRTVLGRLAQLFESGVRVLVDSPEAREDVTKARHAGRIPWHSPYTIRINQTTRQQAEEQGWLELVGQALIWVGPYTASHGVGLP